MWFEIQFLKRRISESDWNQAISRLKKTSWSFKLLIVKQEQVISFFLESNAAVSELNSELAPLRLVPIDTAPFQARSGLGFKFWHQSLIHLLNEFGRKREPIQSISIKVGLRPFPFLPCIAKVVIKKGVWLISRRVFIFQPLHKFLAFNLDDTIDLHVVIARAQLEQSDLRQLGSESKGLLLLEDSQDRWLAFDSFDYLRHAFIIGQSGSGKSHLLNLLVEDLRARGSNPSRIVILDPHGSMLSENENLLANNCIDFASQGLDLFSAPSVGIGHADLLCAAFVAASSQQNNQRMERVLRFAMLALMELDMLSEQGLRAILTDAGFRRSVSQQIKDRVVQQFLETEYSEYSSRFYAEAVLPILTTLDELGLALGTLPQVSLLDAIKSAPLTTISIPQTRLGQRATRLIGGLLISQMFALAQSLGGKVPLILIVDEVALVQHIGLSQILAEARKFNLSIYLACQFLGQLLPQIKQSIGANVPNYFCFQVSSADSLEMGQLLGVRLLANEKRPGQASSPSDQYLEILAEQGLGHCVVRLISQGRYLRPFRATTRPPAISFKAAHGN